MLANDDYLNEKVDSNTIKLKSCGGVPNERTHSSKPVTNLFPIFVQKIWYLSKTKFQNIYLKTISQTFSKINSKRFYKPLLSTIFNTNVFLFKFK